MSIEPSTPDTLTDAPPPPPTYDCRKGDPRRPGARHKVITADSICVLCGTQGVIDARHMPAQPFNPTPTLL
ncbi:hypothetical protein RWH43_10655 [Microbacterium sp. KSW2-21]|uniref:HNH endonuclease n=1 Tax=Microbacterium algihabitans TaxID=3075992 RepID=A0ABU3RWM5_9MICO|nr:hypothetical protein [Microbacterium sp. KSW2-21]MDU0327214.1 hypothetical protein [Microbacterium sp. KSW2-21]